MNSQHKDDGIDQIVFEFAVGREKTVPPHIRTALIESQPSIKKLKSEIQALIATAVQEARYETAKTIGFRLDDRSDIPNKIPVIYWEVIHAYIAALQANKDEL